MPAWNVLDPATRRPVVEILRNQTSKALEGTENAGLEGRVMLEGITCDTCHQVTGPVVSAQEALDQADGRPELLEAYLEADTYQGNPYWQSFLTFEDETQDSPCFQTSADGDPLSDLGDPCKLLFREEDEEGDGISNSGYFLDPEGMPAGQDPRTRGDWRFGPRFDPPAMKSSFHLGAHVPLELKGPVPEQASADDPRYHLPEDRDKADYFRSAEFCGSCHDVRIIGTDARKHQNCNTNPSPDCFTDDLDRSARPEFEAHKRLRDAYSEWRRSDFARNRKNATTESINRLRPGDSVVTCQDCHMSAYPVIFEKNEVAVDAGCEPIGIAQLPPGTDALVRELERLSSITGSEAKLVKPGCYPIAQAAVNDGYQGNPPSRRVAPHYFTGADVPLEPLANGELFSEAQLDDTTLDGQGMIRGLRPRRDLLLKRAVSFVLPEQTLSVEKAGPVPTVDLRLELENIGAGHRVPAGFTQEREVWVEVVITDLGRNTAFRCGSDDMFTALADEDHYPRLSRCASALRFGEAIDERCTEFASESGSLEDALTILRLDSGVLAHVGALVDQDHDGFVIGVGPGEVATRLGNRVFDDLNYDALLSLFMPETGQLDPALSTRVRLGDNGLFLLDRVDGLYLPILEAGEIRGEARLVERADGRVVDEDLPDKRFDRIRINDEFFDAGTGGLIATYGADIFDGPDKPRVLSRSVQDDGVTQSVELLQEGLINFQNGFLTCVACCPSDADFTAVKDENGGTVLDASGNPVLACQRNGAPIPADEVPIDPLTGTCCRGEFVDGECLDNPAAFPKATNMVNGVIGLEDGVCRSNLVDETGADLIDASTDRPSKFLEIFSPIEGLTADSGAFKAADAIINERSLPPGVPHRFTDRISLLEAPIGDLCVQSRLNFRAFPPYELRMFALRELLRMAEGERDNPTMSLGMVDRLEAVVIGEGTLACVHDGDGWVCVGT